MKKIILSLSIACIAINVQAQNVTIPDVNFKNALIASGVDTSHDGIIQTGEALAVTRLFVHGKSIADLTGIGAFTKLTYLNCDSNQLSSLDVHTNIHIDTLICSNNQITNMDISMLPSLTKLLCNINKFTTFNTSSNTALKFLDIGECFLLTSLDLSYNPALTYLDITFCTALVSLDLRKNTNLDTLSAIQDTKLLSLDVSLNTTLVSLDVTNYNGFTKPAMTICVNATQMASHSGWSKNTIDVYSTTNCLVGIDELSQPNLPKNLLHIYNLMGQEVNINEVTEGVFIYQYSDGSFNRIAVL